MTGHKLAGTRAAGFTMVELIMVIVIVGVLAAVAASRFFVRTGFDVAAFAEQVRAMARYAQKLAVAQNRVVWVTGTVDPDILGEIQGEKS